MKKKKRLSRTKILKNFPVTKFIIGIIIVIGLIYLLWPQKSDPLTFDFGDLSYVGEVNGKFSIRVPCNITNISEKEIRIKKVTLTLINMTSRDSTFWEEPSPPTEFTDFELLIQSKETLHKYLQSRISWEKDPVLATVKYTFYIEQNDIVLIHLVKLHFPLVYTTEIDIFPQNLEVKILEGDTILSLENIIQNNSPMEIHLTEYGMQIINLTTKDGFVIQGPTDKSSQTVSPIIGKDKEFIIYTTLLLDDMGTEFTEMNILFYCLIEETNGGIKWGLKVQLSKQNDDTYLIYPEPFFVENYPLNSGR